MYINRPSIFSQLESAYNTNSIEFHSPFHHFTPKKVAILRLNWLCVCVPVGRCEQSINSRLTGALLAPVLFLRARRHASPSGQSRARAILSECGRSDICHCHCPAYVPSLSCRARVPLSTAKKQKKLACEALAWQALVGSRYVLRTHTHSSFHSRSTSTRTSERANAEARPRNTVRRRRLVTVRQQQQHATRLG